jgi:hypothetical protein
VTVPEDWAPEACTLPTSGRPLRIAEFDDLFGYVLQSARPDPTLLKLVLPRDVEAAARDLAQRESECCSFFTFTFDAVGDQVVLHIYVPASQVGVLDVIETRVETQATPR